ncbi:MAG: biotin-independent malonate decarboxylase subunit gamma [Ferrovum sp. 37-45-19]|uniref:biotin-independent malonate decarboxylase subunit gamma n=1 Tax=Ferrovum sp. JA12 TaxID=1356299 RepID=UPI0007034697|nr:biotin-independent malonate decarboxylase subunit gamma [Ferrovum sp. JA12]OYV80044.1 MAG: biotin-independent malonate decarboxylase subunit gamma [Ferrovum sp. 21-44-67]OYV93635.1 MAG: biotin-independent malonate decarboxylase subunit gamma [Ferrovum sp. 37-45-19]OZB33470.1 MAG: biotin-independent malonate decarboxylase subunit gamma [Ferrovum sp. 34-44-207]HQT81921.1 biotin-independent malonate decarboxylase subunit gamma [Ferrovaceae bacterium]KRH78039.1 malonyl-S-ACP:biotin-protein carb
MSHELIALWQRLFPLGYAIQVTGDTLCGSANTTLGPVHVLGTTNHVAVNSRIALTLAQQVMDCMLQDEETHQPRPIIMIADTQGQELSRREELLGLNGYFAHLARCVEAARLRGHRLVTLIHGEAVSGGFLAFGLLADAIVALPQVEVRVMDLRAMARITRIDYTRLTELAQDSPVFAPGPENYWRMGGIHELWTQEDNWAERLVAQCGGDSQDTRAALGLERKGRLLAFSVAQRVLHATPATPKA